MKVRLITADPWAPTFEFSLERFPATIGRDDQADLVINNQWTSRQHCELSQSNGSIVVRDLDSKNGILLNGKPVTEAIVASGDTLTVGIRSFQVAYRRTSRKPPTKSNGRQRNVNRVPEAHERAGRIPPLSVESLST